MWREVAYEGRILGFGMASEVDVAVVFVVTFRS